ncbi:MAG: hypothetical protein CMJ81_12440 [Planctomycetaceae bacterium]|nr:hypothetical protein [Planctomycetaceae bacterium]MBP63553.1 hypothetical protein [Planctomycetaceae bacterium]
MDTQPTNSRESLATANRVSVDWGALSGVERIRHLELEGYVVIPDLISTDQLAAIGQELAQLPTKSVDYSPHQGGANDVHWTDSPESIRMIALPPMVEFLQQLFGDELICTSVCYACSQPGHPGIAIHTDSQPYGSQIFGLQASSPCLVRVLYYLDELTPLCSPFKAIPRSHLSLHSDAIPYKRYLSHKDEVMVTCKAGSAAVINQKFFHGNYPNYSDHDRRMLAIAYRPAWAGPTAEVEEWDPRKVAKLPAEIQPFFQSLNTRRIEFDVPNRPDGMLRSAAGINPGRWEKQA